jgi:hypothetical protein
MAALPEEKAGIASGVLAMTRTLAGALLLATGGALFQHVQLERRESGNTYDAAFAGALSASAWLLAALLALGALVTWLLVRGRRAGEPRDHGHLRHHGHFHL